MHFEFHSLTDPGLHRDNNEDSVAHDRDNRFVVLADGMGGYNAGEVASAMATECIHQELGRWMGFEGKTAGVGDVKRVMETCVGNANRSIYRAAQETPKYLGMGTTLVMGVFHNGRALIGHVGDSRCYRLRAGTLKQITRDHSLLQEQMDAGLISPEQAQFAVHKNLVTRAMGVDDTVALEINERRADEGDIYLFCSDGLSDMLPDTGIADILRRPGSLDHKCRALVNAANDRGGRDNISVILVELRPTSVPRGLLSRLFGTR